MKIAVIGNCQAYIARIISVICRNSTCTQIHWNHIKKLISMNEKIDLSEYDYIFSALTPDKELDCVNNIDKKSLFIQTLYSEAVILTVFMLEVTLKLSSRQ